MYKFSFSFHFSFFIIYSSSLLFFAAKFKVHCDIPGILFTKNFPHERPKISKFMMVMVMVMVPVTVIIIIILIIIIIKDYESHKLVNFFLF